MINVLTTVIKKQKTGSQQHKIKHVCTTIWGIVLLAMSFLAIFYCLKQTENFRELCEIQLQCFRPSKKGKEDLLEEDFQLPGKEGHVCSLCTIGSSWSI